jgi:hypothetical protein
MVDDDGHIQYSLVARDVEHVKELFRAAGTLFGPYEVGVDAATTLEWSELTHQEAALKTRCHTEDDRGVIAPADANIGDWFCSEW